MAGYAVAPIPDSLAVTGTRSLLPGVPSPLNSDRSADYQLIPNSHSGCWHLASPYIARPGSLTYSPKADGLSLSCPPPETSR